MMLVLLASVSAFAADLPWYQCRVSTADQQVHLTLPEAPAVGGAATVVVSKRGRGTPIRFKDTTTCSLEIAGTDEEKVVFGAPSCEGPAKLDDAPSLLLREPKARLLPGDELRCVPTVVDGKRTAPLPAWLSPPIQVDRPKKDAPSFAGHVFAWVSEPASLDEAYTACVNLGARLVQIESVEKLTFLQDNGPGYYFADPIWTGAVDCSVPGVDLAHCWLDGQPFEVDPTLLIRNVQSSYPGEALVLDGGKLQPASWRVDEKAAFVCEWDMGAQVDPDLRQIKMSAESLYLGLTPTFWASIDDAQREEVAKEIDALRRKMQDVDQRIGEITDGLPPETRGQIKHEVMER